jgi:acyl-CoA thioesterase I
MFVSASLARIHRAAVSGPIASIALGILLFFASPLSTLHAAESSTAPGKATAVLLVLGDSISAEYGLPRDSGWVKRLGTRLQSRGFGYRVVNASISGETTSGGLARLDALLAQWHPAIVIVELGGNDGLRGLPIASTDGNLDGIVTRSQKAGAAVLLVGMQLPPNYGKAYADRFAALYAAQAKRHRTALVPFLFDGFGDRYELFQPDRIHPTEAAQDRLLDNVWPGLEPLLKRR